MGRQVLHAYDHGDQTMDAIFAASSYRDLHRPGATKILSTRLSEAAK